MTGALLIGLGLLADAAITAWVVHQVPHWLPVAASSAAKRALRRPARMVSCVTVAPDLISTVCKREPFSNTRSASRPLLSRQK